MFLGIPHQKIGTGPVYLTGVFLYAGGKDGYRRYSGELPLGIRFDLGRSELTELLGEPDWQARREDGSVAIDRWDQKAPYRVHVTYGAGERPAVVSLFVPKASQPRA